jgi:asparagine synthase (glutamine-hydrolysing)
MRLAQARFAQKAELKAPICARMEQVHALQNTRKHRHSMCGIYGHFSRERADIALVEAMGAHLTHRGPDGQGMYCDERLAFGATRLAIIDLSAPSGAIFNEDRTVAVVFNGEIYNYQALRAELERLGHRFATRTDTEVLVHGYEEWRIQLLERLRGMFAFAVWDGAQLLLARDRLGEKPLYYAQWSGDFYFASELKALLRSPKAARQLDRQALLCYMTLGYAPPPLTPFEDIHKLGAGEYLTVTAQGARKGRYWQARMDDAERRPMPYAEAVRRVRSALEEAVANCLVSDVPVGVFLSGGLDSSITTALAARQLGRAAAHFHGRLRFSCRQQRRSEIQRGCALRKAAGRAARHATSRDSHCARALGGAAAALGLQRGRAARAACHHPSGARGGAGAAVRRACAAERRGERRAILRLRLLPLGLSACAISEIACAVASASAESAV